MKDIIRTFIVLCTIANALCLTCLQNYSQTTIYNFTASDTVGQFIDSSSLTENTFAGAGLYRADITPVSGTFYIIPGQDSNTSNAIWSTPFSSSSDTINATGTVSLTPSSSYTFLWVRDGTGEPTSVFQAGDWISNSAGFTGSAFGAVDVAGQFCFITPASPSATPSPSSAPTPSVSASPSPSATPSTSPAVLPPNHPPVHYVRGFNASQANVTSINEKQIMFRNNQGSGQNLYISINDPDYTGDQIIRFTASIVTVVTSGNTPAQLSLSNAETQYVNEIANNASYIELTGTLPNINAAIARTFIKWTQTDSYTFRVWITVDDLGNTGGCDGVPCSMWTMSRTEFRTTPTGV